MTATREIIVPIPFKVLLILSVAALMAYPFCQLFMRHGNWQPLIEQYIPPGGKAFSESYVALLRGHRFDDIMKETDPALSKSDPQKKLTQIAGIFPKGAPKNIKAVGADILKTVDKESLYHLLLEYEFVDKWIGVEILFSQENGHFLVEGFNALLLTDSAEHANRFTFSGKPLVHYAAFTVAVILMLADFGLFVRCVLLPPFRRQWLWAAFILIGLFHLDFNWTSGRLVQMAGETSSYDYLTLGIPIVQLFQAAYSPVIVRFCLPLGALLFLWRSPERTE